MSDRVKRWTEGPWYRATAEEHGRMFAGSVCADDSSGARWVLFQGNSFLSPQERKANNHLIAAAPEMAEALDILDAWDWEGLRGMPDHTNWKTAIADIDRARAALAKAYGETNNQEPTP